MKRPSLSVVMSVYNDAAYVGSAIESILSQTFREFEFIIVDDGSTDAAAQIISNFKDERIVRLQNASNQGMSAALNSGIERAQAEHIVRMDADDIALPSRLERQIDYMHAHPALGLFSSWYEAFDEDGSSFVVQLPCDNGTIQDALVYRNCFCHPAAFFRKSLWAAAGRYQQGYDPADDLHLWLRMAEQCELGNVPEVLLKYRVRSSSLSGSKHDAMLENSRRCFQEAVIRRCSGIGFQPSPMATARYHLFDALVHLLRGDTEVMRAEIERAIAIAPNFIGDHKHISNSTVEFALEAETVRGAAMNASNGALFINQFFGHLPFAASSLQRLRRETMSLYHIALAFRADRQKDPRRAFYSACAGLLLNPRWVKDRGVLSMLARSFLPGIVPAHANS